MYKPWRLETHPCVWKHAPLSHSSSRHCYKGTLQLAFRILPFQCHVNQEPETTRFRLPLPILPHCQVMKNCSAVTHRDPNLCLKYEARPYISRVAIDVHTITRWLFIPFRCPSFCRITHSQLSDKVLQSRITSIAKTLCTTVRGGDDSQPEIHKNTFALICTSDVPLFRILTTQGDHRRRGWVRLLVNGSHPD